MKYSQEMHDNLRFYCFMRNNPLDQEIANQYAGIDVWNILLDEIDRLEAEVNALQEAWLIDETIQPDGSLRPSIGATIMRLQGRINDLEAK